MSNAFTDVFRKISRIITRKIGSFEKENLIELKNDIVQINGHIEVDEITANTSVSTPAISSPNGDIFACRAWVNFDGTTAANVSGTYVRTGTTVTVTVTNHNHQFGHYIYFDATSGTATDGSFLITAVLTVDTFTFTHGTSGATSGNCTLNRWTINYSGNIHSIVPHETGAVHINALTSFPSGYIVIGSLARPASPYTGMIIPSQRTTKSFRCYFHTAAGAATAFTYVNLGIIGT